MLARFFLPIKHVGRQTRLHRLFKVNPDISIEGFTERWCMEMKAVLQERGMENGLCRRSISLPFSSQSAVTFNGGKNVVRGYPLSNQFLYRQPTDGGIFTITDSNTHQLTSHEGTFDMSEYMKNRPDEAISHLLGRTAYRCYTEAPEVAYAFALSKGSRQGAIAIEHWSIEGSVLPASLYAYAAQKDPDLVIGLAYQQEIAGPFLPLARQRCTTICYKDNRALLPGGFNIISPFNVNINEFLFANSDPVAVQMIHEYDQSALRASLEYSAAFRELRAGQRKNLSEPEMRMLQERVGNAYKNILEIEVQFRNNITKSIKAQIQQGNTLMERVEIPSDLSPDTALRWYLGTIGYSKGRYITPSDNECSLKINKQGNFILEWEQGSGRVASKVFSKEEVLDLLPHIMFPAFDLIHPDGQFNISENIPYQLKEVLITALITKLITQEDPYVNKFKFYGRDLDEVSSVNEKSTLDEEFNYMSIGR